MKKRFFVALVFVAVVAAALPFAIPAIQQTGIGSVLSGLMGGNGNESNKTTAETSAPAPKSKKEMTAKQDGNTNGVPSPSELSNQKHAHQTPNANEKLFLLAVKNNDLGTAEQMLKAGVDVDGVWPGINSYSSGGTAYSAALREKNLDMMQFLRKNGADIEGYYDYNNKRVCYLECATRSNLDINIVQFLLHEGADVNGYTDWGDGRKTTAIDNCAEKSTERAIPIVQLLIEKGAYIENTDEHGFTPFLQSINKNNTKMMQMLADGGANLSAKDKKGRDGLQIAVDNNNLQLYKDVQEVISQGQKPSKSSVSSLQPKK